MKRRRSDNLWWGMWWLAVAVFLGGWFCFLTGCGAKAEAKEEVKAETSGNLSVGRFKYESFNLNLFHDLHVVTDNETGREYLVVQTNAGVGVTLMPEHVEAETFTGETEAMVFSTVPTATVAESATVTEEPVDEAPELASMGDFKVTAYCACEKCCGKSADDPWYGITATGTRATEGRTIAVDPKVIPYGTVVYFEGPDGLVSGYVAEDCGGAIKGNDIDLYFDSHAEALSWGVREKEVFHMEDAK